MKKYIYQSHYPLPIHYSYARGFEEAIRLLDEHESRGRKRKVLSCA